MVYRALINCMPSNNDSVNGNTTSERPKRSAASEGEARRRLQEAANRQLDKKLKEDMGTSDGYYSRTKAGTPRKEYYGE